MKRMIVTAIAAALALPALAVGAGVNFDGHSSDDPQAFIDFTRGGGKVHHFLAYKLKYGPGIDHGCPKSGRTNGYRLRKALTIANDGTFHGHGQTDDTGPKGPASGVTMKVSGKFVSAVKAKGVVSLTDRNCTTRKMEWVAEPD